MAHPGTSYCFSSVTRGWGHCTICCVHLRSSRGTLIRQLDGGLRICLDPPDLPLHRCALAGLCADLNPGGPVFPGTDIRVHYEVAASRSEARRPENDRGLL